LHPNPSLEAHVDTDLDVLAVALYVTVDDLLKRHPDRVPPRPPGGFAPRASDAELVTLAVMAALLQFTSERRWVRYAQKRRGHLFPYLPKQSGLQQAAARAGRHDALADRVAGPAGVRRRR